MFHLRLIYRFRFLPFAFLYRAQEKNVSPPSSLIIQKYNRGKNIFQQTMQTYTAEKTKLETAKVTSSYRIIGANVSN